MSKFFSVFFICSSLLMAGSTSFALNIDELKPGQVYQLVGKFYATSRCGQSVAHHTLVASYLSDEQMRNMEGFMLEKLKVISISKERRWLVFQVYHIQFGSPELDAFVDPDWGVTSSCTFEYVQFSLLNSKKPVEINFLSNL